MHDPDKQKDVHELNIDFPVSVKVYNRLYGDKWRFVCRKRVASLKELGQLQDNAIYDKI